MQPAGKSHADLVLSGKGSLAVGRGGGQLSTGIGRLSLSLPKGDRELVVSILAWREQHVLGGNEFI